MTMKRSTPDPVEMQTKTVRRVAVPSTFSWGQTVGEVAKGAQDICGVRRARLTHASVGTSSSPVVSAAASLLVGVFSEVKRMSLASGVSRYWLLSSTSRAKNPLKAAA